MPVDERLVSFEACFNFRDLGGYPTADGRRIRWGRLYRSDTLHRLTAADLAAFASLGLRTAIDLRTVTEIEDHGSLSTDGRKRLSWHHVPIFDGVMRLQPKSPEELAALAAEFASEPERPGQSYVQMLGDGSSIARVFDLLTKPGALPGVFHCTSGKDRTGMIAAMTLDLLGVDDDLIGADYVLTNETRERAGVWISANEPVFAAFLSQIPPERRRTQPETILGFLDAVRSNFGSVEKLLIEHGVTAGRLDAFRENLLEQ
jgi:protein-tyrosine phosphatase